FFDTLPSFWNVAVKPIIRGILRRCKALVLRRFVVRTAILRHFVGIRTEVLWILILHQKESNHDFITPAGVLVSQARTASDGTACPVANAPGSCQPQTPAQAPDKPQTNKGDRNRRQRTKYVN